MDRILLIATFLSALFCLAASGPVVCGNNQYYDVVTSTCSWCGDICSHAKQQRTESQCQTFCPGYKTPDYDDDIRDAVLIADLRPLTIGIICTAVFVVIVLGSSLVYKRDTVNTFCFQPAWRITVMAIGLLIPRLIRLIPRLSRHNVQNALEMIHVDSSGIDGETTVRPEPEAIGVKEVGSGHEEEGRMLDGQFDEHEPALANPGTDEESQTMLMSSNSFGATAPLSRQEQEVMVKVW